MTTTTTCTTGNEESCPSSELPINGVEEMSTDALLSLLLDKNCGEEARYQLAGRLIDELGGIEPLSHASAAELCTVHGIDDVQAGRIAASFQLGRRATEAIWPNPEIVAGPADVYHRLCGRMASLRQEVFIVLALDVRGRVLNEIEVARGSLASVDVHPREVFRPLIRCAAFACVAAHNHPSGDPTPSPDDLMLSDRLQAVGQLVGIELLDHVIVARGRYRSLADRLHPREGEGQGALTEP